MNGAHGVIFQCASCRALAAIHDVRVREDRAGLACNACGSVTWLPIHAGAHTGSADVIVEAPKELPPVTSLVRKTPAAIAEARATSPGATSFAGATDRASTGVIGQALSAEQRSVIEGKLKALPVSDDEQEKLARAFEALLDEKWGDYAAHKELCARANSVGELAFIGQRYRAVLDAVPGEPLAKRAQGDILTLATVALNATKDLGQVLSDEDRNRRRAAALGVGILIVAAIFLVLQMSGLLRPPEQQDIIDPAAVPAGSQR